MKTNNNNKGFTLIELIMVIVILGILSAVAVPKFFDLTASAKIKSKQAVIGNIKSGLHLYAANEIVTNGTRKFPEGDAVLTSAGFSLFLDESPEDWTVADNGSTPSDDSVQFIYKASVPAEKDIYTYFCGAASTDAFDLIDE